VPLLLVILMYFFTLDSRNSEFDLECSFWREKFWRENFWQEMFWREIFWRQKSDPVVSDPLNQF
jgi:hypothetical protein